MEPPHWAGIGRRLRTGDGWLCAGHRWPCAMRPVEERLCHVDQRHLGHDEYDQDEEECGRQGREPKDMAQTRERQGDTDCRRGRGHQHHRQAGSASEERYPPGTDHVDVLAGHGSQQHVITCP